MAITSKVGNLEVIHSGVVHLNGHTSFEIWIDGWHCLVEFREDDGSPRYSGKVENDFLTIILYNHKNSIGESITAPFAIANQDGKSLYMTYYTQVINQASGVRRFEYLIWRDS